MNVHGGQCFRGSLGTKLLGDGWNTSLVSDEREWLTKGHAVLVETMECRSRCVFSWSENGWVIAIS